MENILYKFIVLLLTTAVTSAITSLVYKVYKPSEKANKIAERVIKFSMVIIVVVFAICAIYIILADMGYVKPITPSTKYN